MSKTLRSTVLGLSALVLLVIAGLQWGAVSGLDPQFIVELRLSRIVLAIAIGAGLSLAGALLQALFSNSLCEPYTLGVSSGAAAGAAIGASLGWVFDWAGLGGFAFLGAALFSAILWGVSHRLALRPGTLLLVGVMLGFVGSSFVSLWMALVDPSGVQSALFWLLGDLSRARLEGAAIALAAVIVGLFWALTHATELDALLLGEDDARSLGVDTRALRRKILALSSVLVAFCVAASGMVGFVGLIVPHFVRITTGALHRRVLPLCALWGAVALVLSDLVGRVAARPFEIPVGVVTALWGAPLFAFVLLRRSHRGGGGT